MWYILALEAQECTTCPISNQQHVVKHTHKTFWCTKTTAYSINLTNHENHHLVGTKCHTYLHVCSVTWFRESSSVVFSLRLHRLGLNRSRTGYPNMRGAVCVCGTSYILIQWCTCTVYKYTHTHTIGGGRYLWLGGGTNDGAWVSTYAVGGSGGMLPQINF